MQIALRSALLRALLTTVLLLAAASAQAQAIVDIEFVKKAIERGALLWDTRDEATFVKGHIPGAVNIGDPNNELRDPNREDYLPLPQIEKLLGSAGIDPQREIVVYGVRAATSNYFAHLTLRYFGAARAYVFHDGIDAWRAAGLPLATQASPRKPVALKLVPQPGVTVGTDEVLAAVRNRSAQIVDARTTREFSGDDIRSLRGGHIPGAVNVPYEQNWQDPQTLSRLQRGQTRDSSGMSLKPVADLRTLYAGLDPNKETIVYCQSGVRAAETATVLRDLGFRDVKVYDASWLGWGSNLALPAANETFFNVGALNSRLARMQMRIDQLEAELEQARRAAGR
jgi:thiosulfate/3-mercaptopyruvate sulfurtransferase